MQAACATDDIAKMSRVFFEDALDAGGLARARTYCFNCPMRRECLADAMEFEDSRSVARRFGVWALLTPIQRASLALRGEGARRCQCGELYDPAHLLSGRLRCACGRARNLPPLSEAGDGWTDRHTKVAERALDWLVEHVLVGEQAPVPSVMADKLSVRRHDVARVYIAFIEDGTLSTERVGKKRIYKRKAGVGAMKHWRPAHAA
jgi:Transcription factor WhiB